MLCYANARGRDCERAQTRQAKCFFVGLSVTLYFLVVPPHSTIIPSISPTNTSAQTMTAVSFFLSSIVAKNGIIYFQCISLFFSRFPTG